MKLVGCLQNLPCYNFAGYVHRTSAQRTKGVANRTLFIGNPDFPSLLSWMIHVHTNRTRSRPIQIDHHSFLFAVLKQ